MNDVPLRRRVFLKAVSVGAATACLSRFAAAEDQSQGTLLKAGANAGIARHPARWWKDAGELRVECGLCPRKCRVADRERGACGVRENQGGKYYTLVHSRPCAAHLDPIEKKPFYHVLPGQTAFSLAAPGCNIECKFCQNWDIAQVRPEQVQTMDASPDAIVRLALDNRSPAIACTYTEPVVWSEYVYDIAVAAKKAGLRSLMVSNGFIQAQPMSDLADVLSAIKIDLKAFTERFYHDTCHGELKPVLDTLRLLGKRKKWTEIVVLVIPGMNDNENDIRALARFVKNEVGPDVPVHFTRFHPNYRLMNVPSTPVATIERCRQVAMDEGLHFAYVGNVLGHPGNHTYCPGCKKVVVRRTGLSLLENRLKGGKCPQCGRVIPGLWA